MTEAQYRTFFRLLGERCRALRERRGMTQEDLLSHGFSVRHYQQIEAGLAINLRTAIRLAEAFEVDVTRLLRGLTVEARAGSAALPARRGPGRPRKTPGRAHAPERATKGGRGG